MYEACACWDELANDNVFFQAEQRIDCGADGCACQHLDSVLEGGCREERVGAERCLGETEQDLLEASRLL